ncbi:MAG: GAF domain-containing sensor histidine kinase [Candidatus Thermoplasmatota archaeon]|nr:GAF domain-containing sensor histidine kinase [Candidatus Thermoplasmatota archaeon]
MGGKYRSNKPDSFSSGDLSYGDREIKKGPGEVEGPFSSSFDEDKRDFGFGRSMDLIKKVMDVQSFDELMEILTEHLPVLVPFDMGTLRWKDTDNLDEEWDVDTGEGFLESKDFISRHYVLSGAMELDIQEDLTCEFTDTWNGGMEGTCRARTITGDPVIIRLRSALVIPLYFGSERIGVISLYSSREEAFRELVESESVKVLWKSLGNILGRTLEARDIKGDRDRARALLDSSEDILVLWKRNESVWEIDCNKKADIFINRPNLSPDVMEGPFFAPPGKEWERAMFAWTKALEMGETYQVDLELVDNTGKQRPYLCTFSPYLEGGHTAGVKMTGIEIARIDEAVGQLEKMNNGYRLLISVISHDLKNPLSAILGYSELLRFAREEKKDPYIEKIVGLTHRMTETIEMAKVLSQIQEGKLRKDFKLMDISKMLQRSIEILYPKTESYNISYHFMGDTFEIVGHAMLEQVMVNLLDNAMKYSKEGSDISVELSANIGGITLSVKDQGDGIPDEFKEMVFQRFERGGRKDGISGTGLGLAISKGIIDLHNGRIWVEDNEPSGSVFNITLPWSQD